MKAKLSLMKYKNLEILSAKCTRNMWHSEQRGTGHCELTELSLILYSVSWASWLLDFLRVLAHMCTRSDPYLSY
jgi:hypothetical protein